MNPLWQNNAQNAPNSILNVLSTISSLKSQNVESVLSGMLQNNPQFKQFYDQNKNKSMEEICNDYGIDIDLARKLLK